MNLRDQPVLFLDVQTTGMRPPRGQVLEFAWALGSATDLPPVVRSQVFSLPDGADLPKKISEITGLNNTDLERMPEPRPWFGSQFRDWLDREKPGAAVIHCAQFELSFLTDLLEIPFEVLCTQKMSARLFPTLPSRNIRAVSGYFGHPVTGPNRAGEFVFATAVIWKGLTDALTGMGINAWSELAHWLQTPVPKMKRAITYRIPPEVRLGFPDRPGIYKMRARNGEVLYVGKATSLKSRVNSYFRGVKNRDRQKLEMLAQVWRVEVEPCGSPLEAALREVDEIKRLDPRYNISLKRNDRELRFYSRDFSSWNLEQTPSHPVGPFRPGNWIETLAALDRSLKRGEFEQIFFNPIEPEMLKLGFELFQRDHGFESGQLNSLRRILARALGLFRKLGEPEPSTSDGEPEITPDYVAGKFQRLLRRAGAEYVRAKNLTRALNSDIEFEWRDRRHLLQFRGGMFNSATQEKIPQNKFFWAGLDIDTYDRMSVLLGELKRVRHRILRHSRNP